MSPQDPSILPMRIGLAPTPREINVSAGASAEVVAERVADAKFQEVFKLDVAVALPAEKLVLAGSPVGKTCYGPSLLVGANGLPISATPEVAELVDVSGESLNSLTWPSYLAWRKTKTRPYDYASGPALAITSLDKGQPYTLEHYEAHGRAQEEIDQATLEFIGEVAELGELFGMHGPAVFFGSLRDKLIDECGDILFCGSWAFDAWGMNPLSEADDLELIRVADDNDLATFARVLASNTMADVFKNNKFVAMLAGMMLNLIMNAQTNAGLTANSLKKLKYQRREQAVETQIGRIANALLVVNQILVLANSSVEEALKVNMRKLDARRPGGYDPSKPGGNRTGEGA